MGGHSQRSAGAKAPQRLALLGAPRAVPPVAALTGRNQDSQGGCRPHEFRLLILLNLSGCCIQGVEDSICTAGFRVQLKYKMVGEG